MAFPRVLRSHTDPSKRESARQVAPDVERRLSEQAGLQYRFVAYDPATGDGVIASVWDTREQAVAGVTLNEDEQKVLATAGRERVGDVLVMEISNSFVGAKA